MATNFPTSLDSFTNPTEYDQTNSATVSLATLITNLQDAVLALETAMGLAGTKTILSSSPYFSEIVTAYNQTTDATPTEVFTDGSASRIGIPANSTVMFEAWVVGRRTDADNESAGYKFTGLIDNNSGTTALAGPTVVKIALEDTSAWDVAITADDANDALIITVTGEGSKTIEWAATVLKVRISE